MSPERWNLIERLFLQAVELPEEDRATFLEEVCLDDEALRQELHSLLASDHPATPLIVNPFLCFDGHSEGDADAIDNEMTGRRIGSYRVIRLLGRGGMGAVYLGTRDDDQYQKQVAIKLLKRGMDTNSMLSRFRQERQILANLEHPFIARLMDGGATDDGLPYLVLEYVDGFSITRYCADQSLDIRQRLRLFRLVCEAVQYAHQHLVIHRDLKPANILITKEGIPKLLDFGVAKLISPGRVSDSPTMTQPEFRFMTPDYASPEQAAGGALGTSTDIYSLGVVLYELLSGQRPHCFTSDSLSQIRKTIREGELQKPSAAIVHGSEESPYARRQRKRQIAGDLDNIVLMALRKEPQRRYASAAQFSEDLRRHMDGLPVMAQKDRWSYRARKFVSRHKLGVAAALLLLCTLIGGIVTTRYETQRAQRRFQMVRGLANSMLFDLHDEMERLPGSTALRASTIRTVVKYLDTLAGDGSQDNTLELEIATAYARAGTLEGYPYRSNLGHGAAALSHYRKALIIFERLANHPELRGQAIAGLVDTHLKISEMSALLGNPADATSHFEKASAIASEALARNDRELPRSTQVNLYYRLADAEYQRGAADRELAHYLKALQICQKWVADEFSAEASSNLRDAYKQVGSAQARSGDLNGARNSFQRAQRLAEDLAKETQARHEFRYNVIELHNSVGDLLAAPDDPNFGDRAGALTQYQVALDVAEQLAAADRGDRNAQRNVVACYRRLGMMWVEIEPARALDYYRKALTISEELMAGDPSNSEYRYAVSRAYMGQGEALHKLRRDDDAIPSLTRAVELQKAIVAVSPERIWNLRIMSHTYVVMGEALLDRGDPDSARDNLREALAVANRMLQRAPSSLYHQLDRADVFEATGRYYLRLSTQPGITWARRATLVAEARSWFQQSLITWQNWTTRKLAMPYAARRQRQAVAYLASCGQS